jgi:hypothetical protein
MKQSASLPSPYDTFGRHTSFSLSSVTRLEMGPYRNPADMDIVLGSNQLKRKRAISNADGTTSKPWGAVEDEDDDDDDEEASWRRSRLNYLNNGEEEATNPSDQLPAKTTKEIKAAAAAARKRALELQEQQQALQDKEHALHAAIAQTQGLEFQVLVPPPEEISARNNVPSGEIRVFYKDQRKTSVHLGILT